MDKHKNNPNFIDKKQKKPAKRSFELFGYDIFLRLGFISVRKPYKN